MRYFIIISAPSYLTSISSKVQKEVTEIRAIAENILHKTQQQEV